jgi:hypothetical protein
MPAQDKVYTRPLLSRQGQRSGATEVERVLLPRPSSVSALGQRNFYFTHNLEPNLPGSSCTQAVHYICILTFILHLLLVSNLPAKEHSANDLSFVGPAVLSARSTCSVERRADENANQLHELKGKMTTPSFFLYLT